ncbi:MAG: hypothetical protein NC251_04250 [Lachnoclostridium sp.]|nr:hypothetical protein [Lachnospira sp.]MCM1247624.1 hypothetical protein [Lachnoclostridium sp.]
MFICGSNFVGGESACALTPTNIENINYIELKNGIYDDLYVSKNTDFVLDGECPAEWDFDTVLWAKFNGNTSAGNVDWNLETTSHIVLKSRREGEFQWKTIAVKEIHDIDDFVINYPDYFVASGQTMEYAIVNVLYGSEGNYATAKITPKFHKMFLIEENTVWSTEITDGYCNTTRNIPSSTVELLNSKYPVFVRNTAADYDTGSCAGAFVPFAEESCEFAYGEEYDYQRTKYQKDFMDFLCDGAPKILKMPDGRMWIVQVTPNPADNAGQNYNDREISWNWVEIGDVNSEQDLYYLGLSDVPPEWWNQ